MGNYKSGLEAIASPLFLRKKKKQFPDLQEELDNQVKKILSNPLSGEAKKGPLKGIRVHKFTFKNQIYLISYQTDFKVKKLYLYTFGTHERFYNELTRYLKS